MYAAERTDHTIREDVLAEMAYDPAVTVNDIAVVVQNGIVTLSGAADSYGTREAAVEAAERVSGVRGVINTIVVDPRLLGMPDDAQIAASLRERLDRDFLVPRGRVTFSVHDGVVTLGGTVDWHFQREAAREEAAEMLGVRDVINQITIDRTAASPAQVEAQIRQALLRHARLDAGRITVTAQGGHVVLSGGVRSLAERQEAEDAAWRARGVTEVTDNLTMQPAGA